MTTPKMGLAEPQPGVTPDLTAAQNIVDNFSIIDDHDHTAGKGGLIPSAGINVNSPLQFNNNQARSLGGANLTSLGSVLSSASDNRTVYALGNELYYRDGSGNNVAITAGGSVAGASGTISGLTGAATVAFSTGVIDFRTDATPLRMIVAHSDIRLYPLTSAATNFVTLRVPTALATTYTLTLPNAVPVSTQYLSMNTSGDVLTVSANDIVDAYTRTTGTTVGVRGVAISTSSASFSTTSTSTVDVTNLTVTITTSGRPVVITMIGPVFGAGNGQIQVNGSASGSTAAVRIVRDASSRAEYNIGGSNATFFPCSSIVFIEAVAAGTYVYKIQTYVQGATTSVQFRECRLLVYEL
jgi:hypothetical protein